MPATATNNKVKFNLKNVHYAKLNADGTTYGTVKELPGAVSLSLDAQGDINKFYADGVVYYQSAVNGGYEGDLEIAMVTDEFRIDILGEEKDSKGVMLEKVNAEIANFALGFTIDGDQHENYFWYYNCTVTRPSTEASTTEDTKTPQTDKLKLSCVPNKNNVIRAKSSAETDSATTAGWFSAVYASSAS